MPVALSVRDVDAGDAEEAPAGDAAFAAAFPARDGACTGTSAACARTGIHSVAQNANAAATTCARSRDRRTGRLCAEFGADDMAAA
jgi:hypothetical protein